jgi:hypothetical protein
LFLFATFNSTQLTKGEYLTNIKKMKNILYLFIGGGIIAYLVYVLIQIFLIVFGVNELTWSTISVHIIVTGILLLVLVLSYFFNNKKGNNLENQLSSKSKNITTPSYNQYEDKLAFTVYQQHFKTWWFDTDGDKHNHSTIYANLRFYEDGTVIGIRSTKIPKINIKGSYIMIGNWTVDKNSVSLTLKKIEDVDDTIKIDITEYEERQMKYAGKIADDDSLIKAGEFQGIIEGNNITIGNHLFSKLPVSTLIVTASKDTCSGLELKISNHDHVVGTFKDTGNWYSNGETGPEWFTIHINTSQDRKEDVETLVKLNLKKMGKSAHNLYWT